MGTTAVTRGRTASARNKGPPHAEAVAHRSMTPTLAVWFRLTMLTIAGSSRTVSPMDSEDIELRNATYRRFVELGRAPTAEEVATQTGRRAGSVRDGWQRLHDAHALVLDASGDIAMADPFAARPTPFQVEAHGRAWWANCAWDAFGIGAALKADSVIHTTCADCQQPLDINVRDGQADDLDLVFHVLVPAASWWDDIGFT